MIVPCSPKGTSSSRTPSQDFCEALKNASRETLDRLRILRYIKLRLTLRKEAMRMVISVAQVAVRLRTDGGGALIPSRSVSTGR